MGKMVRSPGALKGQKAAQKKKKNENYIHHVPYLRNGMAYDHNLWYSCLNWWYIQIFISCFSKFWFFGVVSMVKGQKMAQNAKKVCLSCFISQETYIIWFSFKVHMYKMIISRVVFFFILSKLWFSGL